MDNPLPFERLSGNRPLLPFDCGDEDINDFLVAKAWDYHEELLAVTYFLEDNERTVFYFTLLNDKVTALELSKGFWRRIKALFPHSKHRKDYPAVKIGRLGVHKYYQHSEDKWGTKILDFIKHWMVADNKTGCRFITVDAYCSAVPFYLANGFMFMGADERSRYESGTAFTVAMYYDLKHISVGVSQ